MDKVTKGIVLYRVYVTDLKDVSDDELRPLVRDLLGVAGQDHVWMEGVVGTIAQQLATKFPRIVLSEDDRDSLAGEIIKLARTSASSQ